MTHAFRSLLKSPGFTITVIFTLALGIGVNTAMFSVLNGFLLRPLAFPESDRLFRLYHSGAQQSLGDLGPANFADLADATGSVAELAAFRYWAFTVTQPGRPADVPNAVRVTTNFFPLLGLQPELGRPFRADEATSGNDAVLLLSHRYWQKHFGGDRQIVGQTVYLDGQPAEIIGVLPKQDDTSRFLGSIGIFRPLVLNEAEWAQRGEASLGVLGRYRDGVTPDQAATQFDTLADRLAADYPVENRAKRLVLQSLQSTTLRGVGRTVTFLLVGLSGFVLLIACANLANLMLARALARSREFSIRAALGANRRRLIQPLALECLLLAILGGSTAMLVSAWTSDWLAARFGSADNPANFALDGRVLAFALLATAITGLLFGIAPAWWAARVDVNAALKSATRMSSGGRGERMYRQILIVTQFALALILLTGAGFFMRGVGQLVGARPGWNPDPVITGVLNLASARYNAAEPIIAFHRELRERLLAIPGVANAAVSFEIPLYQSPAQRNYLVAGRSLAADAPDLVAFTNAVSPSYFDTVGIRLRRGRLFEESDGLTAPPVVVINEALARGLFPQGDALGQRLALVGSAEPQWAEIVGIVEDAEPIAIAPPPLRFYVYKPYAQEAWQYVTISVRAADADRAASLLEPIRRAVAAMDPDQPVLRLMPVTERIRDNLAVWITINQLLMLFAALGLLLATVGIYGVVTHLALQRTTEFGIRIALGAQVKDIMRLVLHGAGQLAVAGTAIGALGAYLFSAWLSTRLPGLAGSNWLLLGLAAAVLVIAALLASYLPARRATKADPLAALRPE
ncbi:MAG TPA: ABC transporter permease [Candidatus Synoicihabitans sp.]|nr:ABC transporter permease [Candidatus Synoicihabitans sp.]